MTTSDKEWQRVVQQVATNDNEWPFRLIFLFFQIREEPTTKHPKENSLNLEDDLWRRPIKLRAETSTQKETSNSKKQELQKQLFAEFHQNKRSCKFCNIHRKIPVSECFFRKVAGLEPCKSIKRRLQYRCFPVNIPKLLKKVFSIGQIWWLLLELRYFFSLWYITLKFMKIVWHKHII